MLNMWHWPDGIGIASRSVCCGGCVDMLVDMTLGYGNKNECMTWCEFLERVGNLAMNTFIFRPLKRGFQLSVAWTICDLAWGTYTV